MVPALDRYLAWSRAASAQLANTVRPLPLGGRTVSVLDLPLNGPRAALLAGAVAAGYRGVNIGLTPIWKGSVGTDEVAAINATLPIVAVHGTSIKAELRTGTPYQELLRRDLAALAEVDPEKKWLVNYDLYAGHVSASDFSDDFSTSLTATLRSLRTAFRLRDDMDDMRAVLRCIIQDLAAVFAPTGRRICFEIPGTRGWSLLPEVTAGHMAMICDLLDEYFPAAGLCIDVGHVLTWGRDEATLERTCAALAPYADRIRMVHISSAGSWQEDFLAAYAAGPGASYPAWHRAGLDLSLPVCEPEMLTLIARLRGMCGQEVLEVSETRLPSAAVRDYFPDVPISAVDDTTYVSDLVQQGTLLGYRADV